MRPLWLAAVILLLDQTTKLIVRTSMHLGQSIPLLGDWLKLTFTENPGMAFGISVGSPVVVTSLAIAATILIVVYLRMVSPRHSGFSYGLALILGGAIGNIIDRIFYAPAFGYGGFFEGQVVDFIHVDLWGGVLPSALPLIGGLHISLFPIWNVADMSIVIGVALVILLQQRVASEDSKQADGVSETLDDPDQAMAEIAEEPVTKTEER